MSWKKSKKNLSDDEKYEMELIKEIEDELPNDCDDLFVELLEPDDDILKNMIAVEKAEKLGCLEPLKKELKNKGIEFNADMLVPH